MSKTNILVIGEKSKIAKIFLKQINNDEKILATDSAVLDLANTESINTFARLNKNTFFDAVIFFASIYKPAKSKIDMENIQAHLKVHFFGPLQILQKIQLAKIAKVIFLCDSGTSQPKRDHFGYSFSKSILQAFIRHLAIDFAPDASIVGIDLGPMVTDKKGLEKRKFHGKSLIQVDDPVLGLVRLIRFIIHEPNFYVSGQIIPFDGGTYINRVVPNDVI